MEVGYNAKDLNVCTRFSVCGIKLWNSLHVELKGCIKVKLLKKKQTICQRYKNEECV